MTTNTDRPDTRLFEKQFQKGDVLFREGENSRELYVLLSGAVTVGKGGVEIARLADPGAYFGEISALLGSPRTATVVAAQDCRLLVVGPDKVADLFGHTPDLGLRIARVLAARLARTTADLAESKEWFLHETALVGR